MPIFAITANEGQKTVLEMQRPAPGIVYIRVDGFLSADVARRIMQYVADTVALSAPGPIVVYDDWYELVGYAPEARQILTGFAEAHKLSVSRSHICFRSKLVAIAVNVANALVGNLVGYANREDFLVSYDEAVAESRAQQTPG